MGSSRSLNRLLDDVGGKFFSRELSDSPFELGDNFSSLDGTVLDYLLNDIISVLIFRERYDVLFDFFQQRLCPASAKHLE